MCLFGTNSFTIDVDQTIKEFGEYVTGSYDKLCDDFMFTYPEMLKVYLEA